MEPSTPSAYNFNIPTPHNSDEAPDTSTNTESYSVGLPSSASYEPTTETTKSRAPSTERYEASAVYTFSDAPTTISTEETIPSDKSRKSYKFLAMECSAGRTSLEEGITVATDESNYIVTYYSSA